jgi:hypothetical protein
MHSNIASALYHIFADQVKDEVWTVSSRRYLKKSTTESRRDQNFEGLRPGGYAPGYAPGYVPELMAECIVRLERTAS